MTLDMPICKTAEVRPRDWSGLFPRFRFELIPAGDGGGILAVHDWIPGVGVGETVEDAFADWFSPATGARQ